MSFLNKDLIKFKSNAFYFTGISQVFITLQIENSKVEPPIDKYRLTHKASPPYSEAFYQQEYSVDFKAGMPSAIFMFKTISYINK